MAPRAVPTTSSQDPPSQDAATERSAEASTSGQSRPCSADSADILEWIRGLARGLPKPPAVYSRPGENGEPKPLVKIHTWADVKTRRELDLLASIGVAGGLQAATFVPTSQHPLSLASASLPSGRDVSGAGEYGSEALLSAGPGHPGLGSLGMGAAPPGGILGSGGSGAGVGSGAMPRSLGRAGKASKSKGSGGGRTYTSRFRGVHQTFPTRRWEAQFRRAGKPTSLGCFDREEEAARAYDKMMLWCELHNVTGVKGGITNFELSEYEGDVAWLQKITQDQLVQVLRSDGRRQAAARNLKQKRDGHSPRHGAGSENSQF